MREYKFRAFDKVSKKMIYSDERDKKERDVEYSFEVVEDVVQCWWEEDCYDSCGYPTVNSELLDNIMQYTGLKDKNGTEIYEGDILTGKLGKIAEVKWLQEHCSFVGYCKEDNQYYFLECGNDKFDNVFVIGNIYENPELLEVRE